MLLSHSKFEILKNEIKECGDWAKEKQSSLSVRYKDDKSPVTEVDMTISHRIITLIKELFPDCAIISEEEITENKENAPYTFVLDPIDGTDMYSQGLSSFCTALGILDSTFNPVGAIIYAPRFGKATDKGLFLSLYPGEKPFINGKELELESSKSEIYQITFSSSLVKHIDFTNYEGKIRMFGSQILQIVAPLIFINISCSISEPCYIWDYSASHAVIKSLGYDLYKPNLEPFTYSNSFLKRNRAECVLYGGEKSNVEKLIHLCPLRNSNERIIHY